MINLADAIVYQLAYMNYLDIAEHVSPGVYLDICADDFNHQVDMWGEVQAATLFELIMIYADEAVCMGP